MIELLIAIFFATYVIYHLYLKKPSNFPPGMNFISLERIKLGNREIIISYKIANLRKFTSYILGPASFPFVGSLPFLPKVNLVLGFGADWIVERYS